MKEEEEEKNKTIKKSTANKLIGRWRMKYEFDHACYQKSFVDLYKRINNYEEKQ
jgi:hypothetical protein